MRRFISAILAVLVIVLSCIPCNDAAAIAIGEKTVSTANAEQQTHNDGCGQHDECSPFCTCSCCASVSMPVYHFFLVKEVHNYLSKPSPTYLSTTITDVFLPIWQPPQILI